MATIMLIDKAHTNLYGKPESQLPCSCLALAECLGYCLYINTGSSCYSK